jgi:uncharacterized protein (TIGR02453 family)
MDTKIIYKFLQDLNKNNSLEWMKDNKQYYEQAKNECENLIMEIQNGIKTFDNSIKIRPPKDYMFRLNKDTRFSSDKSPYNPSFRAHISTAGKLPIPVGYFISIKPNNTFLGGGLFASMFSEATKNIRDYIIRNGNRFEEIIETKEFKNNFVVDREKLKNVPKEYDKEHKLAEYLKYKSWYIEYKVDDKVFFDGNNFIKTSIRIFGYMKPFNDFINTALKDFKMPERK